MYVLVHWDTSREGQSDEWAIHAESDGTEHDAWSDRPDEQPLREAIALAELPVGSNLPSAADQARAISVAAAGEYYFIRESSDTPLPW